MNVEHWMIKYSDLNHHIVFTKRSDIMKSNNSIIKHIYYILKEDRNGLRSTLQETISIVQKTSLINETYKISYNISMSDSDDCYSKKLKVVSSLD